MALAALLGAARAREVGAAVPLQPPAGSVTIGRDDLLKVRTSLQRISDELHLILGVLDDHLDATPPPAPATEPAVEEVLKMPLHWEIQQEQAAMAAPLSRWERFVPFAWAFWDWSCWAGIAGLDVGLVVAMQLFLESIGRKKGGSSIMPKKGVAAAISAKAAGAPPGAPIPAPSATPGRDSSQRLAVLSQEELLASWLTEHWAKLAVGVGLAFAFRTPQHLLSDASLMRHMLVNFIVMLRCMSLVMMFVRDDMALPKKEWPEEHQPPGGRY